MREPRVRGSGGPAREGVVKTLVSRPGIRVSRHNATYTTYERSFPALIERAASTIRGTSEHALLHPLFCVTFHKLKKLSTVLYEPMPIQKVGAGAAVGKLRVPRVPAYFIWTSSFVLNACLVLFDSRLKRAREKTQTKSNHRCFVARFY